MSEHRLSDFAEVRLGFKSFLNDFFYVDEQAVGRFEIEDEYLVPLLRLDDLDKKAYRQKVKTRLWLLNCKRKPEDLRGTGAGAYIEWGTHQKTRPRKQTDRSVPWPEAPALEKQKHWYWPAAPVHLTRLAIRKGVNDIYAPFVFNEDVLLDQRLYLIEPKEGVSEALLIAYLSSSLFALALETNADLGLGAGVLTMGANNLRALPVIDLKSLEGNADIPVVKKAVSKLLKCKPPGFEELAAHREVKELDKAFLQLLNVRPDVVGELHSAVAQLGGARLSKARKRTTIRGVIEQADIDKVVESVSESLESWLKVRRFPEDFCDVQGGQKFQFPSGELTLSCDCMLDRCTVIVAQGNMEFLHAEMNVHMAEVLARALQMGRRSVVLPKNVEEACLALGALDSLLEAFEDQFGQSVATLGIGERHKKAVLQGALERVHMPLDALQSSWEDIELRV